MLADHWPQNGCILVGHRDFSLARAKAFDYAEQRLSEGSVTQVALIKAGTHPDFRYLEPEEGSQWIKLEPIRDLITWATHKPILSQHRVAILSAAEALNTQAANALLKTLEESSLQSTFILLSHQPALVLSTLRSRCYRVDLRSVEAGQTALLEQVPLMQADLQGLRGGSIDPITLVKQWTKSHPLKDILDIFWQVLAAALESEQQGRGLRRQDVWGLVDKLLQAKKSLTEGASVNDFLVLGALWIEYAAIMDR